MAIDPLADAGPTRQRLVTIDEVADYLDIPVQTLYRWRVDAKGPPAVKLGRHLRYRWSDVDAWVDAQEQPYSEHL